MNFLRGLATGLGIGVAVPLGLLALRVNPGKPGIGAGVMQIAVRDPMVMLAGTLAVLVFMAALVLIAVGSAKRRYHAEP